MIHPHSNRRPLEATDAALEIVSVVGPLTISASGNIAEEDGHFLLSLVERVRPAHILEIGVASGTSTLMLLRMMERLLPSTSLDSVDLATEYYVDPAKPVAFLVADNYANPPENWRLVTGAGTMNFAADPKLVWDDLRRHYELVFIDAHHGHPWPTLDALCLLPYTAPGSWVAFHDINLPMLGDFPDFGPTYVLEGWPHDVTISERPLIPNIGAIRLTDAARDDAASLIAILERKWDCGIHPSLSTKIFAHLKTFLDGDQLSAVRECFAQHEAIESR